MSLNNREMPNRYAPFYGAFYFLGTFQKQNRYIHRWDANGEEKQYKEMIKITHFKKTHFLDRSESQVLSYGKTLKMCNV